MQKLRVVFAMLAALVLSNCSRETQAQPPASPRPSVAIRPTGKFHGTSPKGDYWTPSTWTNYQENDGNNAVFPGSLSATWSFDTKGKVNGSLAVVRNTIFVDSFSKKVWAIDIATGRPHWSTDTPRIVMSTPVIANGLVFVGTGTNDVLKDAGATTIWGTKKGDDIIALSATDGKPVWKYHTVGEDMPTPEVIGGKLIFSNGDMHAYALDVKDGHLIWKTPMPGVTTMSATAIADGLAFLVSSHGLDYVLSPEASHIIAVEPESGKIAWSAPHPNADCSPTVADHLVMCEGSLYTWYGPNGLGWIGRNDVEAFDTKSGKRKWRWVGGLGYYTAVGSNERGISGMVHDHILYQAVPTTNELIAFRVADGKILWRFHTAGPVKMSPLFWNGKVIFGDTEGLLYAVDASTGEVNNVLGKNQPFSTAAPVIVGNTLFIANGSTLHAIPLKQLVL